MKKGVPFEWDEACQNAFDGIKAYPLNPPVLIERTKGDPSSCISQLWKALY